MLALWAEAEVSLTTQVRLIDLRDPALARLGLDRDALVATSGAHYPYTRRFAEHLHGRVIGGHVTHGVVWHSRQADLHTRAMTGRPAVRDLLERVLSVNCALHRFGDRGALVEGPEQTLHDVKARKVAGREDLVAALLTYVEVVQGDRRARRTARRARTDRTATHPLILAWRLIPTRYRTPYLHKLRT